MSKSLDLDHCLSFIRDLARDAGTLSLEAFKRLTSDAIEFKNPKDLVTAADREVEKFILDRITERYPDHALFGEETGRHGNSDFCWIVDPIDGTVSFVHELPFYAISIALYHHDRPLVAAVHGPRLGELFSAAAGQGAYLGERRLQVSTCNRLIDALLCTGFACVRAGWERNNLPNFERLVKLARGIRRHGSAALDLCYVAAGRLDAYWEMGLQPYDYAAGRLILEEAGGRFSDMRGGENFATEGILATNALLHDTMQETLNR